MLTATHQDLQKKIAEGSFREDLYHRLNVISIELPPLRERSDDIALLARHFLRQAAEEMGLEEKHLHAGDHPGITAESLAGQCSSATESLSAALCNGAW